MESNPLVSLIIPVYNRLDLLPEMLNSILQQTYQDWECIIVDDGSHEDVKAVVDSYISLDNRFKFYNRPSEHLPGGNGARNYGFLKSNGDYINWLDSDDSLHEDFISKKIRHFLENENLDIVVSKTVIKDFTNDEILKYEDRTVFFEDYLNNYIQFKFKMYLPDPLVKKKFLVSNKVFYNEELLKGQDYDFHIRILLKQPHISISDEYLYFYRLHSQSISGNVSEKVGMSMINAGKLRCEMFSANELVNKESIYFHFNYLLKVFPAVKNVFFIKIVKKYYPVFKFSFMFSYNYLKSTFWFVVMFLFYKFTGKGDFLMKKLG